MLLLSGTILYWYSRDINKAKEYYAKYKAVADVDASNDYEEASIKYASKDLDGAINQSKADITKYGEQQIPVIIN
jgi:D-mannonate dehydratase